MIGDREPARCPTPTPAVMTRVVVRGLDHTCWKCHQPTMCVVAVHTDSSQKSEDGVWFEVKHALAFARELLLNTGQTRLAETIKRRCSHTARGAYLSNGCGHCDTIQGDWPLGRAISDYGLAAPLSELPILALGVVAEATWSHLFAGQTTRRHGYPMSWDNVD